MDPALWGEGSGFISHLMVGGLNNKNEVITGAAVCRSRRQNVSYPSRSIKGRTMDEQSLKSVYSSNTLKKLLFSSKEQQKIMFCSENPFL